MDEYADGSAGPIPGAALSAGEHESAKILTSILSGPGMGHARYPAVDHGPWRSFGDDRADRQRSSSGSTADGEGDGIVTGKARLRVAGRVQK